MAFLNRTRIIITALILGFLSSGCGTQRVSAAESFSDLVQKVEAGKIVLKADETHGYLRGLLDALEIPVSSQTLVFSKSSFQMSQIAPDAPRAIYFNDDVYVGWVHHGQFIEIAEVEPETGPVFYSLKQDEAGGSAVFTRETDNCLVCHDTFQTKAPVPRLLMLSVLPNKAGNALKALALITNDQSPFRERWGGWYVTGRHGNQQHLGNTIVNVDPEEIDGMKNFIPRLDLTRGANVTDLNSRFNTKEYLSPHSDIAALMVLGHQTHVHNMITSGVYSIRDAASGNTTVTMDEAIKDAGEKIVRTMLFVGETQLTEPVSGTSTFVEDFSKRGPRDSKGRSLRDLDLKKRLLKYPLSYLVYSRSFDAMPENLKEYVARRFREVLTGIDKSGAFQHLSDDDRKAILEILNETKPGLL